ncbi:MAG: hypothetical protein ACOC0R_01145 [Mariniphaga sp.]
METIKGNKYGRVRKNTSDAQNRKIDLAIEEIIEMYRHLSADEITCRLTELKKEWGIEKTLEVNASSLALTGLILGTFGSRKWYLMPLVVASFLLQHGLQGWCPPLPLFRKLGIRTRQEIDEEMYALKILRGDFDDVSSSSQPEVIISGLRK